jgi:hypothetical protein
LAVSKQAVQKFDMERFSLRKPKELEVRKQYQINISNKFATKENFSNSLGLYKLKLHKPWLVEESVCFLDQRKQVQMQWLQDPNQRNVNNINNARSEASRHFRNKMKEYLKTKIDEGETDSKIKIS